MNKQKLFEELLKKRGIHTPKGAVLTKRNTPGPYGLSFAQRRIWFLQQFDAESAAYNDPTALRIKGALKISVLEQTLNEILRRHKILRMIFFSQQGQPKQQLHENGTLKISIIHLEEDKNKSQEDQIHEFVNHYSSQPFDLAHEIPVKATVLKIAENDYALVVNIHHIVMDGWSKGIMLQELMDLYEAFNQGNPSPLKELPVEYTDYIHWQQEWMQGKIFESQLKYWRNNLSQAPPILEIPTDFPRPNLPSGQGSLEPFLIPSQKVQALKTLAQRENVTLFMLIMAVYNTLLYRYSHQEDILVGTPIAGRHQIELEPLIGLFVNTLVMRSDLSGYPTFKILLTRIRATARQAYSNQDMPFERLVEELNPQRNLSVTPLFQVMFQLQNAPMPPARISGLTISPIQIDTGYSQVDLSLTLWEEADEMKGSIEYNTDLFTSTTIKRMICHFKTLLDGIIADVNLKISQLPLLTIEEKHRLLVEWNDTEERYPQELCLYQLFESCQEKYPEEVAVTFAERRLTYSQLNKQADRLAHYLHKMDAEAEKLVGICMENSLELIVGVIGILKAGSAYIPMDPAYPDERLISILKDSHPLVLITQSSFLPRFSDYEGKILVLEKDNNAFLKENAGNYSNICTPYDAACIIYTSGSTGEPKGIVMENRSIVNLVYSFIRSYKPGPGDNILPLTSIASASFVGEILPMITSGGGIVLADKVHFLDMKKLTQLMTDFHITILSTVPSMIARLNNGQWNPGQLRLLLSGGETLSAGDIDRLRESITIVNGYGLTEGTICSTFIIINKEDEKSDKNPVISVGKPIINTQIYILVQQKNPVPIGVTGELYIGGDGITRGYLNNPEMTAERFIQPFNYANKSRSAQKSHFPSSSTHPLTYSTLFRTGDLGAWQADGTIKFIGRVDTQVQIHGYRIELSEIENHLGIHPDIQDVVVIDREVTPGDRRLVAYFVVEIENGRKRIPPSGNLLREWLGKRIPDYMLPGIYVEVEEIPLNANGKADIAALPLPSLDRPELDVDYKAPQTEVEKLIAATWQEFLHLDKIGINDNFFDLGGHSLLLIQVHSRLNEIISNKKEITIVDLFRYPTIYSLGKYIDTEDRQQQSKVAFKKIQDRAAKQRQAFTRRPNRARGKNS